MGDGAFRGIFRAFSATVAVLGSVGAGVSLSGCPIAAPLENDERFTALKPGPIDCAQPIPDLTQIINCDYTRALTDHCARGGCHNTSFHAAELDLTLNPLLIARILEEPSKHVITCPGGMVRCNLSAPQCARCASCPSGPTDVLLSKSNPAGSFIMVKMDQFDVETNTAPDIGCGIAMPAPSGGPAFTAERRTCLTNFFTWIAQNGTPCELPAGGSGGGGAGGAGTSGTGSGGTG
jgi:hypothetical protein